MRSFILFLSLCIGIFSFGCSNNAAEGTEEETEQQKTVVDPEEVASTQPQKTEDGTTVTAVYKSVSVHTGRVDYEFLTIAGDRLIASVRTLGDNTQKVSVPDNMLNETKNDDGSTGPNPAMVDKTFKLYYDKDSKLVQIELTE